MNMLYSLPLLVGVAEGGGASGGAASMAPTMITFGLVFAIFYFLIIRPQSKRQKKTQDMLKSLKKGDRVQTIGGIRGTIFSMKEETVVLKVDDHCKIQFARSAVAQVLDKSNESSSNEVALNEK